MSPSPSRTRTRIRWAKEVLSANYYWHHKGWHKAVDIMHELKDEFDFLIVSQGRGYGDFRKCVLEKFDCNIDWRSFVHPSRMPQLIDGIDGVFMFFENLPYPAFSNLVPEVLYCGRTVITDYSEITQFYQNEGLTLDTFSSQIVTIDCHNVKEAINGIRDHFRQKCIFDEKKISETNRQFYQQYLEGNERMILSLL